MGTPETAMLEVREWAKERLRSGTEPPWTHYRFMQLLDALVALEHGPEGVTPTGHSLQSEAPSGERPQQEGNIYRLDNARHHDGDQLERSPT